jgi:serine/threonine protein kinase
VPTETERPVQVGDVLAGKYRVERVLGEGGMGLVVAAMHMQLEQLVAVKFVLPSMLDSKTVVERFLRESRAAVRLKSEHAAKVLDVGTLESGAPYMVMEYLEGCDLGQVQQQQGVLAFDVAADYVLQACEAVAEAHSLGIVHRDLKPQNLFLTTRVGGAPLIKVLDFGISKMASEVASGLTQTQTTIGSPLYMAPEQMRSARNVDGRADIWALGVVLYKLMSGEVPFQADTMPELCYKVVHDPPRPLTEVRPDVPAGLAAIVMRCLEKEPEMRFANVGELASALEPFAPVAAYASAERARSVSGGTRGSFAGLVPIPLPSPLPTHPSHPSLATNTPQQGTQPIPTISSWGDTKGGGKGRRMPGVLVALGALVAITVIGFVALRMVPRSTAAGESHDAAVAVGAVGAGGPGAPPQAVLPGAAERAREVEMQVPPAPILLDASAAPSLAPPPSPPSIVSIPNKPVKPANVPAPQKPSKPTTSASPDNDIPNMR